MNPVDRLTRHARITWKNLAFPEVPSPPFLILFINSICNLTCEHCFYWRNLNRRDDLTVEEIFSLARELGRIEILNLSGGEPFLRQEFAEICRFFIANNGVEQIYVPTNGYFTDRTVKALSSIFEEKSLKLFVCELSIDGMPEYHNKFRGNDKSFQKLIETYDTLAEMQKREPRLRIHAISTATSENMGEIKRLTTYLYDRCPAMDHHNLALIRGDRKNPSLQGPDLLAYKDLAEYSHRLWAPREESRYGSTVEPMLHWAKVRTAEEHRQVIPCRAGVLTAVVYANGDVSVCETHPPLANLRQKSFREIWYSQEAQQLRRCIRNKECWCTNEIFMWSSINYQPVQLARALVGAKVWQKSEPLPAGEKLVVLPTAPGDSMPAAPEFTVLQDSSTPL
ncbi:MAG TPA: radical SAM protein [Terriglobales bacterium]|jgi:MoaA/NifB/PqqE/SkfB family radical SAM enzyme|nr:radical SAM protein [Terriglobales bacterium]